jgi:hypothetical protein
MREVFRMQTYQAIDWQGHQFQQYYVHRLLKRDRIGALRPGVATNAHEYLHLFEQTARASSSLKHPHILPVYDSGVQAGNQNEAIPYLVYPYLEQATTLHAHLQRSSGTCPLQKRFGISPRLRAPSTMPIADR